jgi:hypothetical protein
MSAQRKTHHLLEPFLGPLPTVISLCSPQTRLVEGIHIEKPQLS